MIYPVVGYGNFLATLSEALVANKSPNALIVNIGLFQIICLL